MYVFTFLKEITLSILHSLYQPLKLLCCNLAPLILKCSTYLFLSKLLQTRLEISKYIKVIREFPFHLSPIMARSWPFLLLLMGTFVQLAQQMTIDPERIAARLRIEAELDEDYTKRTGRNRRQLGQPKEVTIQVGHF